MIKLTSYFLPSYLSYKCLNYLEFMKVNQHCFR